MNPSTRRPSRRSAAAGRDPHGAGADPRRRWRPTDLERRLGLDDLLDAVSEVLTPLDAARAWLLLAAVPGRLPLLPRCARSCGTPPSRGPGRRWTPSSLVVAGSGRPRRPSTEPPARRGAPTARPYLRVSDRGPGGPRRPAPHRRRRVRDRHPAGHPRGQPALGPDCRPGARGLARRPDAPCGCCQPDEQHPRAPRRPRRRPARDRHRCRALAVHLHPPGAGRRGRPCRPGARHGRVLGHRRST